LMQVVLVRLSHGAGIAWGALYIFYVLEISCKLLRDVLFITLVL